MQSRNKIFGLKLKNKKYTYLPFTYNLLSHIKFDDNEMEKKLNSIVGDDTRDTYVAINSKNLCVAYVIIDCIELSFPELYCYTSAQFRNLGIMTSLLSYSIKRHFVNNRSIYATINSENIYSLILHLKLGFKITYMYNSGSEFLLQLVKENNNELK